MREPARYLIGRMTHRPTRDVNPIMSDLRAAYDVSNINSVRNRSANSLIQLFSTPRFGNHTAEQGTAAARPTYAVAQQNALPAATFDGGDTLALPSNLYSLTNGANTIFAVAKRNTEAGTTANIISMGDSAVANRLALSFNSTAGELLFRNDSGAGASVTLAGVTNTVYSIIRASFNGTTGLALARNNGTASTATTGALCNTIDRAYIGSRSATDLYLTGGIGEILIYNRLLTAAEIIQVNRYLSVKWGITIA